MNPEPITNHFFQSVQPLNTSNLPSLAPDFGGRTNNNYSSIGAIIGAVVSLIGTGLSLWAQNRQVKKQNEYNKQTLDAQNAYNSPAAQMERYQAAGLNPYLIANGGAVGNGNSEQLNQSAAPGLGGLGSMIPLISLMSQLQMNQSQMRNNDASAALKTAQALTETTKQRLYQSQAHKNDFWVSDYAPTQISSIRTTQLLTDTKIKYMPEQMLSQINYNYVKAEQMEALIDRYDALNTLTRAETQVAIKRLAEMDAKIELYQSQAAYTQNGMYLQVIDARIKRLVEDRNVLQNVLLGKDINWYGPEHGVKMGKDIIESIGKILNSYEDYGTYSFKYGYPKGPISLEGEPFYFR